MRWYRRPRWIVLMIVAAVAVLAAVPFAIAWSDRGAKEASIDKAVDKFRRNHGSSTAGFLRPAPGVYTFVGTGTEKLSLLATTQHWGPRTPVTVTVGKNRCWKFRIDYSTHHWQAVRYCADGRVLRQTGETTFQSFDFVAFKADDTNDSVCDPPIDRVRVDAKRGTRWQFACAGRSRARDTKFRSIGTATFAGIEKVRVGKTLVPAYRYTVDGKVTGDQSGTDHNDMWYSVRDGLPVKTRRNLVVKSPSPIGTVTYTERGTYTLRSLTPRR